MELRNKFIINSLIGLTVGMFVGVIIWMFADSGDGSSLIVHVIVSGIHGLVPCGAATVFAIESWGITKQTIVHAALTLATILCIDIPMKWWKPGPEMIAALAVYVAVYAIIWLVNYLYWKHTLDQINRQLDKIKVMR